MTVVVVESPAKAKTINKYLGGDFTVLASFGHVRDLPPKDGSVRFTPITTAYGVLVLAGPHAREVLQSLTDTDMSNAAFPWLTGQRISVGAVHCDVLRVNFIGELGYEFHHPIEMQNYLFDLLMKAGAKLPVAWPTMPAPRRACCAASLPPRSSVCWATWPSPRWCTGTIWCSPAEQVTGSAAQICLRVRVETGAGGQFHFQG